VRLEGIAEPGWDLHFRRCSPAGSGQG
jgi:hypothetical protein